MKSVLVLKYLAAVTLSVLSSYSLARLELSPAREIEVSTVKGAQLKDLLGKSSENYSLMAISNGKLEPIPFQFDDIDVRGFPYVPGGVLKINGIENIIEAHDELVFMLKDAGIQATQNQRNEISGTIINELRFAINETLDAYVYVVENNSERSNVEYVSFNRKTGLIKTDSFSLQIKPTNALVWSDLFYAGYDSQSSILDTMKFRIKAKMGFIGATINNNLIFNSIKAVKHGPVRSTISVDATVGILGITLADAGAAMTICRDFLQLPVFITIPPVASVLSDLLVEVSLDFNELDGARIQTALGPKEPIIAGLARTSDVQHAVSLSDNWFSSSTGENFDIITMYKGSDNFKPAMNFLYKDQALGDKPDKPERFKGSSPQVGYVVNNIPTDIDAVIGLNLYFSKDFQDKGSMEKSVNEILQPLVAQVGSAAEINIGEL